MVPSLQTIFLCDDQKAKYNQGACAKPDEQYRSVVALWVSYALDVATDLAGICPIQQNVLSGISNYNQK